MVIDPETRLRRRLLEAEGYIELNMFDHALDSLRGVKASGELEFEVLRLKGEALRGQGKHAEALAAFESAHAIHTDDVSVLMAMAWCYKRTDQLSQAIEATEFAHQQQPRLAVLMYNLACYWTLAGDKSRALSWLGQALRTDHSLCRLIPDEPDFDALREDADFRMIVAAASNRSRSPKK
jgi:tetratricopeptide (TPR) repeat protein